jgi:hypothetical protein
MDRGMHRQHMEFLLGHRLVAVAARGVLTAAVPIASVNSSKKQHSLQTWSKSHLILG